MKRLLTIPNSPAEFDVPDMPDWPGMSAISNFSGASQLRNITQPGDYPPMNLSLADLAFIINTRKSFPDYRPDIIIPSSLVDRVVAMAAGDVLTMTPPQQPPISDDLAVSSILGISKPPPIPLTFNPYAPLNMRPKVSYPSNPRAFGAYPQTIMAYPGNLRGAPGPLVVRSLGMLSAFSAFSDDPTTAGLSPQEIADANTVAADPASSGGDPNGGALTQAQFDAAYASASPDPTDPGTNSPAGYDYSAGATPATTGSNWGTSLVNSLPSLLTGTGNLITAARGPNVPAGTRLVPTTAKPINWTPILLIGGGILAIAILMRSRK